MWRCGRDKLRSVLALLFGGHVEGLLVPLSGGVGWTAWCGLCLSCAKTVPWPAHASSACVAGLGRCRAVRKTRKRMRKASSSCWVTSTGCWLAAMQIVPAHTESGAYGAAGGKACDGGCAGPDALSRAGVKQHPKRQEVHKRKLELQANMYHGCKTHRKPQPRTLQATYSATDMHTHHKPSLPESCLSRVASSKRLTCKLQSEVNVMKGIGQLRQVNL